MEHKEQGSGLQEIVSEENFRNIQLVKEGDVADVNTIDPETEHLTINGWWDKIKDTHTSKVAESLTRLTKLRSLMLEFEGLEELTNATLTSFAGAIEKLGGLERLRINFTNNRYYSDSGYERIAQALKSLDSLHTVEFLFFRCPELTNDGIMNIMNELKTTKIRKFVFNCEECEGIGAKGVTSLMEGVQHLSGLSTLNLGLTGLNLNDESLGVLSKSLSQLKNLRALDITSEDSNISDEGVKNFASALGQLKGLQELTLTLNFGSGEASDEGISEFAGSLDSMKDLCSLQLLFLDSECIGDEAMSALAKSLKGKPLKILILDFSEEGEISDKGVTELAQSIGQASDLNELELNFSRNAKITNNGAKELFKALMGDIKLTSLTIELEQCTKITKDIQDDVAEALKNQNKLQDLTINLSECTIEDQQEFVHDLKKNIHQDLQDRARIIL